MGENEGSRDGHPSDRPSGSSRPDAPRQDSGANSAQGAGTSAPAAAASRELALIAPGPNSESAPEPNTAPRDRLLAPRIALAAAAVAIVVSVGSALVLERREQANVLAERANETESLAQAVKSLKVRLDALDTVKAPNDLADLRQSVVELKSTVISAREFNGALAQLSQRVDNLDRQEGARVDKLSERVDREASALTTELSTQVDKLEKKIVAPLTVSTQPVQPKQPSAEPNFGANISMEPTGSIDRPRPTLRGYIVLDARDDVALIGGRYGEREVRLGDFIPGAGRVERIERKGASWIVLTSEGLIASADLPPY